ncbi:MFS transporter, partial [Mycobacterium sp. ITM-2017-0098]
MQAMGMVMEAAGGISFESFRAAWTLQYIVWFVAVVGILITRSKARKLLREGDDRILLEGFKT